MIKHYPFKKLLPETVGTLNHENDQWAQNFKPYQTPPAHSPASTEEKQASYTPLSRPQQPKVIIIEREKPDVWFYYWLGRLTGTPAQRVDVHHHHSPRHDQSKKQKSDKEKDQAQNPGVFVAAFALIGALVIGTVGAAYTYIKLPKVFNNLSDKRKPIQSSIKLGSMILLGGLSAVAGAQLGMSLGAFYIGSELSALLGGALFSSFGAAGGLFAGKYFGQLITYITSGFKTSQESAHQLPSNTKKLITSKLHFEGPQQEQLSTLMYSYIVNKLEIAHKNQAQANWLKTLEGYRYALKNGEIPDTLVDYYKNEFALLRNKWWLKNDTHSVDNLITQEKEAIARDYLALSLITNHYDIYQQDINHLNDKHLQRPAPYTIPKRGLYPDLSGHSFKPSAPPMMDSDEINSKPYNRI